MFTFWSSLRGWTRIDLFALCHMYIYIYIPKSQLRPISESGFARPINCWFLIEAPLKTLLLTCLIFNLFVQSSSNNYTQQTTTIHNKQQLYTTNNKCTTNLLSVAIATACKRPSKKTLHTDLRPAVWPQTKLTAHTLSSTSSDITSSHSGSFLFLVTVATLPTGPTVNHKSTLNLTSLHTLINYANRHNLDTQSK